MMRLRARPDYARMLIMINFKGESEILNYEYEREIWNTSEDEFTSAGYKNTSYKGDIDENSFSTCIARNLWYMLKTKKAFFMKIWSTWTACYRWRRDTICSITQELLRARSKMFDHLLYCWSIVLNWQHSIPNMRRPDVCFYHAMK